MTGYSDEVAITLYAKIDAMDLSDEEAGYLNIKKLYKCIL